MTWETPHLDEMDRVMGGQTLQHPVHRHAKLSGGEWDVLVMLRPKPRRILTGAGYLTPWGMHPDEALVHIQARVGETTIPDHEAALSWYVRTALGCIPEARRIARERRNRALAHRHGFPTLYAYLDHLAKAQGFRSYHDMRRQRWR
jgi:hypothetical protein